MSLDAAVVAAAAATGAPAPGALADDEGDGKADTPPPKGRARRGGRVHRAS